MCQLLSVTLAVVALSQAACGGPDDGPPAPASVPETTPAPQTWEAPERTDEMKITLSFDDTELIATLVDSESARDLAALLPLTLTLSDYANTEKISELPRPVGGRRAGWHRPRRR